jgi:hypothetical protein
MNFPHISTPIPRRRFLRGLGVTLGLPLLEQNYARAASQTPPKRMLLISNNLGVLPQHFFPKDKGTGYTLSPYLKELAAFRSDFTIFSGLSHPAVTGGHSTENCFLTAARDPTRSGFRNSISLDQFAAEKLGQQTRFPTLNLGVNIDKANRSLFAKCSSKAMPIRLRSHSNGFRIVAACSMPCAMTSAASNVTSAATTKAVSISI